MSLPLALTRRGWACALAAVGVWASWFLVGLRDIWYLSALLGAIVIVSLCVALSLPFRARFDAHLSRTDPTPTVGETVDLSASVRQALSFAVQARITWEIVPSNAEPGHKRVERLSEDLVIDPASTLMSSLRGSVTSSVQWRPSRRGLVEVRLTTIAVTDALGLAVRRLRCRERLELLVLPRPLTALAASLEGEDAAGADGSSPASSLRSGVGAPAGAVREYRVGDAPRQIHWKQSARHGELLSHLHEHAVGTERSVRLTCDPEGYHSAAEFEVAISATAALAQHWIREGHALLLQVGNEPPLRANTLGEALRELATAQLRGEMDEHAELTALPPVVVTGTVTDRLQEELRRAPQGGTLYVLGAGTRSAVPDGWRRVDIAMTGAGARSDG